MRILPPIEQEIRRAIRDERAKDPIMPITKLQDALEKRFGRTFKHHYISRLLGKAAREALSEVDHTQIERRIAFTRENYRMMREELLKIVYWSPETAPEGERKPAARDRIEAAKNVVMMDLALLQAEAAAGMYKKPISELAREIHYEPLSGEVRIAVIAAWKRGGMLPAAMIEEMVPPVRS